MQVIRSWAASLIAASVLAGVVEFLLPKGNFEKPMKVFLSLIFLLSFFAPLSGWMTHSKQAQDGLASLLDEYDAQEALEQTVKETLEREIISSIFTYTESIGVKAHSVKPSISIDKDNNITVKRIEIVLYDTAGQTGKIDDFVYRSFSVHPTVREVENAEVDENEDT